MRLKPINCALAVMFAAGGATSGSALAAGLTTTSPALTGNTAVSGATQSSAGPSFDLDNSNQSFMTSLSPGYSTYAVGNLNQGVIGVQGVIDPTSIGSATETYSTTITNDGTSAAAGDFSFYIGSATLISSPTSNFGSGPGSVGASIDATIAINGQTTWSYGATLTGSSAASFANPMFSMSTTGSGAGPTYSSMPFQDDLIDIVTFSPYAGSVALGTLLPGQSEVLTYTLSGDTFDTFAAGELSFYGGSLAQIGDPFSVQGEGITTFGITPSTAVVAAVPEPSTNLMLAGGLALLGAFATRRKRSARGLVPLGAIS